MDKREEQRELQHQLEVLRAHGAAALIGARIVWWTLMALEAGNHQPVIAAAVDTDKAAAAVFHRAELGGPEDPIGVTGAVATGTSLREIQGHVLHLFLLKT